MSTNELEFSDSVAVKIIEKLSEANSPRERILRAAAAKKLGVVILDDYRLDRRVVSLDDYRKRNRTE